MTKKEVRIVVTGKQRPVIDIELMAQAVVALGRELAGSKKPRRITRKEQAAEERVAP